MKTIECTNCGSRAKIERGDYQFVESGLRNVTLRGVELVHCGECGNTDPIIPRMNDLMRTLALAVLFKPYSLQGQDVCFLRKYLGLTGEEFAQLLDVDKTTLSKWENNADNVGEQSARLIRLIVMGLDTNLSKKLQEMIKSFPHIRKRRSNVRIEMNPRTMSYQYA